MNKHRLLGIAICVLILLPTFSMSVVAEPDAKLFTFINGGIPLISRTFLVVGSIVNFGDNSAYNMSYIFSITGGYSGNINSTRTKNISEIGPKCWWTIENAAFGFGPVVITFIVSGYDIDTITKTAKGFQIGWHTFVSFTLIRSMIGLFIGIMSFIWNPPVLCNVSVENLV